MKRIRWTAYARKKATRREIPESEVAKTIATPDSVAPGRPPRQIVMRRYLDEVLGAEMLLRVIIEESADETVVVTLYKTSKFAKYERG